MEPYERVYGVALLDDVHNFFPELLYNPARFDSIAHVFLYVQRQLSTRFNLFNYGRQRYFEQRYQVPMTAPFAPAPPTFAQPTFTQTTAMEDPLTPALLSLLIRSMPAPGTLRHPDDVVVRPTQQQIQQASVVIQGTQVSQYTHAPEPYVCAICQDSITGTDTCRLLRSCEHVFHSTCIDPWFQRNVRCPVCRHDIRVLPTPPAESPTPAAGAAATPTSPRRQ